MEDSRGDAADVSPSGLGTPKGSPLASSFIGWTTEGSTSEGGPTVRLDSVKKFSLELERTDAAVEEVQRETATKAIKVILSFGNTLIFL